MDQERFATVVVGAGPAGLLFCLVAALRSGPETMANAPILLVDKRMSYERNHRLRMDKRPYMAAQAGLDHPLFDELISFLEDENFRPAANKLEAKLEELVSAAGITKQQLEVGPPERATDLDGLRRSLEAQSVIGPNGPLMVVGADSVKSETRKLVAQQTEAVEKVHQTVARLRVEAEGLPDSLDPIRQLKLAKLLGSAVDYRSNPNGFAEIDLFLSTSEHAAVEALGARPSSPVALTEEIMAGMDAPLFAAVVNHVRGDLSSGEVHVAIQSTFRLEHRYQTQAAFRPSEMTGVFLVGDAAVSLPFFRGMACLMECADSLASVHSELASSARGPDQLEEAQKKYDASVETIRRREVRTVEQRARALHVTREIVRFSAMAPFPIQTWLLSVKEQARPSVRFSPMLAVVGVLLTLAAASAVAGLSIGLASLVCLPLQAAAGALYRADLNAQSGPNAAVAMACRVQILFLMVVGAITVFLNPFGTGIVVRTFAGIGWWVLGLVFLAGMYVFELLTKASDSWEEPTTIEVDPQPQHAH